MTGVASMASGASTSQLHSTSAGLPKIEPNSETKEMLVLKTPHKSEGGEL
jgi:hypothetical protein